MAEESDRAHAADDDEMPETTPGYKVAEKVDLQTMLDKDKEDESLQRYKEQLLGAAAAADGSNASSDPRHVIIEEMRVKVEGRDDIVVPLGTDEAVKTASESAFVLKEGTEYVIEFRFRVQRDVVMGLKFFNLIYKMGVRVDKQTHVIGSFAPAAEPHVFALDPMVAPSGMLARGKYRTRSKFVDDDGTVHLDFEYLLQIKKNWE